MEKLALEPIVFSLRSIGISLDSNLLNLDKLSQDTLFLRGKYCIVVKM